MQCQIALAAFILIYDCGSFAMNRAVSKISRFDSRIKPKQIMLKLHSFFFAAIIFLTVSILPADLIAQGSDQVEGEGDAKTDTAFSKYGDELDWLIDFDNSDDDNVPQEESLYKTVTIGTQVWMAENLNVTTFRNGDPINEVTDNIEWRLSIFDPAWCYYNNDAANSAKYGLLYNIVAVNDRRGLAPEGWHIPTEAEWKTLLNYLGTEATNQLKSTSGWRDGKNGNNGSYFNALPGGYRDEKGEFQSMGENGYWWSGANSASEKEALGYFIRYYMLVMDYDTFSTDGLSVRCIKD